MRPSIDDFRRKPPRVDLEVCWGPTLHWRRACINDFRGKPAGIGPEACWVQCGVEAIENLLLSGQAGLGRSRSLLGPDLDRKRPKINDLSG